MYGPARLDPAPSSHPPSSSPGLSRGPTSYAAWRFSKAWVAAPSAAMTRGCHTRRPQAGNDTTPHGTLSVKRPSAVTHPLPSSPSPRRHARACPGHPRLCNGVVLEDVGGRTKCGHDVRGVGMGSESVMLCSHFVLDIIPNLGYIVASRPASDEGRAREASQCGGRHGPMAGLARLSMGGPGCGPVVGIGSRPPSSRRIPP